MLLHNEIKKGGLYAWDLKVTEPELGCNLFTIIKVENDRITYESIDGKMMETVGSHCFVPAERALQRLKVLNEIEPPKEGSHERWKYDRELMYLAQFKKSFDEYIG